MNFFEELNVVVGEDVVVVELVLCEFVCDELGCFYVIGKCKDVVVCVWIKSGFGKVEVNGKLMNEYFVCLVL